MTSHGGEIRYRCALWRTYQCKNYVLVNGTKCFNCQASRVSSALVSGCDSSNPQNYWFEPKPLSDHATEYGSGQSIEEEVRESIETDLRLEAIEGSIETATNEEINYKMDTSHANVKQKGLGEK